MATHLTHFLDKGIIIDEEGKSYTTEEARSFVGEKYIALYDGAMASYYRDGEYTVNAGFDEADRQCLLLALHKLRKERPGWEDYIHTIEAKLGGQLDWDRSVVKPSLDELMGQHVLIPEE